MVWVGVVGDGVGCFLVLDFLRVLAWRSFGGGREREGYGGCSPVGILECGICGSKRSNVAVVAVYRQEG